MAISMDYSKELIKELRDYFKEIYKINLSNEKAIEYLDSYADLFLAFID